MSVDFISAQLILNSLYGTEEFETYEDPLNKLLELCGTLKKYIRGYENPNSEYLNDQGIPGNPKPLPIKLSENTFSTAFAKIISKDWKDEVFTDDQRSSIIDSIIKKYKCKDSKKKKYIRNSLKTENAKFLRELDSLSAKDLKERLNQWTDYEVIDILKQVDERSSKSVSEENSVEDSSKITKKIASKKPNTVLQRFIDSSYTQNAKNNPEIFKVRTAYTDKIHFIFTEIYDLTHFNINDYNEQKGIDVTYNGNFPPSKKYIHNYFLPWLLIELSPKYGIPHKEEGKIYEKFSQEYEKLAHGKEKSSIKIIEDEKCKGLFYIDNVIPSNMIVKISNEINQGKWMKVGNEKSRVVQHFGYKYNYVSGDIREKSDPMPTTIVYLRNLLKEICLGLNIIDEKYEFNQCIINKYEPGQGISAHIDDKKYGRVVASFTIGGGAMMVFEKDDEIHNIYAKTNSLYIMSGDARYKYKHSMPARKSDKVINKKGGHANIVRQTRISITFRNVPTS
jgi:alkylated DNA repair dioxygenase AlkB